MKENNTATSCSDRRPRVVISGGGTGGHIFPALSIADALRRRLNADIIFVGAEDRMEMTRVPDAGYRIIGLPVAGFDRKHLLRNISVLKKLCRSMRMAKKVIKDFNPDIAIGVGGYASGPTLKAAQKAGKICVAYDGMERFFPADHIVKTGNPIRKTLLNGKKDTKEARKSFGLDPDKTTLLVVGGSLGALTINESLEKGVKRLSDSGIQVIWQTGKNFGTRGQEAARGLKGVVVTPFITDMSSAYKAADLVIGRAGAGSISELQVLGKPVILVPSPNVAEDHQTHNARALSDRGAAVLIKDSEARDLLVDKSIELIKDKDALASMSAEISKMALHDSDDHIVDEVCRLLNCK